MNVDRGGPEGGRQGLAWWHDLSRICSGSGL